MITAVKWLIVIFVLIGSLARLFVEKPSLLGVRCLLQSSFSKQHLILVLLICIPSGLFLLTHSSGYDDIAHLDYLTKVFQDTPFQSFKNLIDPKFSHFEQSWWVARYPFFGVLISVIALPAEGGVIAAYYLFGLAVLTGVLLKIYELVADSCLDRRYGMAVSASAIVIVIFFGSDNYLNYGVYPLQQGKLLFIAGLLQVIQRSRVENIHGGYLTGAGLLSLSWLYHPNLILLFGGFVPFLALYLLFKNKGLNSKFRIIACILFVPILAIPTAIHKEKGFLDIKTLSGEKVEIIDFLQDVSLSPTVAYAADVQKTVTVDHQKREKSVKNDVGDILKLPLIWFKVGKYIENYLLRAFTPEIILLPLLVTFFGRREKWRSKTSFLMRAAVITIFSATLLLLPKQILASVYKPGPLLMLCRAQAILPYLKHDSVYWSDPYTASAVKILSGQNIGVLSSWQQKFLFYPMFKNGRIDILKDPHISPTDLLLYNENYWGDAASWYWRGNKGSPADNLLELVQTWLEQGNSSALQATVKELLLNIREQALRNITVIPVGKALKMLHDIDRPPQSDEIESERVASYRDTALVYLKGIREGELIKLTVVINREDDLFLAKYSTDAYADINGFVDAVYKFSIRLRKSSVSRDDQGFGSSGIPLELVSVNGKKNTNRASITFKAVTPVDRLQLLFTIKDNPTGIYRGRREIMQVAIERAR